MASSTLFRGRRIVDPVPVQRGPLPRDGKYQTSFSDLAAAWENVGEVKSALQAAEARINEANAGLGSGVEDNDEPLQEVFSETQRYGRVSRYELRPGRYGQGARPATVFGEDRTNSPVRRSPEFSLNGNRQESSVRAQAPTSLLSPPSRDSHPAEIGSSTTTRNPPAVFPTYPQMTDGVDPVLTTAYSSIYRANEKPIRRSPVRFQGLSTIPSSSSFDDSLEVGSTARLSRSETRPTSSLGLRPVIANNSDALARLKERIKLQKEQASRLSPTDSIAGISSANPSPRSSEGPSVEVAAEEPCMRDLDVPMRPAISKRKVASAPAAPAYKERSKQRVQQLTMQEQRLPPKGLKSHCNKKARPPKVQRVIAPRRPTDIITTSSWRTGQQTVKRILGPATKKAKTSATSRPQSSSSQDTDISEPRSLNFQLKNDTGNKRSGGYMNGDLGERNGSAKSDNSREASPVHEEQAVNTGKTDSDSELSQNSPVAAKEFEAVGPDEDVKDLRGNRILSTEAKNILSDLELDTDDESDKEDGDKVIPKFKPKQTQVKQSSKGIQRKRPLRVKPQGLEQKYMAKKMAERKEKLKEDRLMKQRAVEEKKKKLEELYSRQKKNLGNNLHRKDKKSLGETYSKGRSDFRSIIYPYNHPFQQDEVECYSEDTGVSGSDKENLDIASFKGLPNYSTSRETLGVNGRDHHSLSSSSSVLSEDGSISPEPHRERKSPVPGVTSVSIGTKTTDLRPEYVGFPQVNLQHDVFLTTGEFEPRSSSPSQLADRHRPGVVSSSARNEEERLSSSPPREDRIAAIKQTAAQLKQRLATEALRLGLNLNTTTSEETAEEQGTFTTVSDHTVFRGALPGVGSLHEQAELNNELGLNWKLPSGRTLRSTVRQGLHQRPGISGAGTSESSHYSTAWDTVVPNEDKSIMSDISASYSSARSTAKSPTQSSKSLKDDRSSCVKSSPTSESRRRKHTTALLDDRIMNVCFVIDESLGEHGSETRSLLEETLTDDMVGETASLLEPPADPNQSGDLLEQTLVEESADKSHALDDYDDDDFTGSSGGSTNRGSGKRTPSPNRKTGEPVYSEAFESPENKTSSPNKNDSLRSPNRSLESGPLSPTLSEGELSRVSEAVDKSSTFSSTRRSPSRDQDSQSPVPPYAAPIYPPPSVFTPSHQGGDRLSPGSLDVRLTAELNRLEYMEESVRQLTDVERTRAVSMAQQETVSLAQILKSKQLSHARDMENLRAKAREEALEAAKQLEEARRAAADAAAGAAETIARVRLEAAASISESADRLVTVQSEAARTTAESAKQVEEARSSAARTLLEVAKQQTVDTRGVAAEAASAAAEAAVKSSMARFHEQQEQLLREREARLKSYRDRSRDVTRDSYSSYSTSQRSDSYSRTRTPRSETDAVDWGSQSKGSASKSRTNVGDDVDVSRSSKQDRTVSVRTASGLSVDRSASHSRRTPTRSEATSRSHHSTLAGEESGSIPEEVDHSVADSVASDLGLDLADDDSIADVLTGDDVKKPSERLERSPEEDYTLNFEETVMSSHTATDDEIDFRMILPSESHRRRSLGKTGRRGSIGSDQGTVSYSSDDNHDSQDFPVDKTLEEFSSAPFSGEDSFSQFTSEMVRLMKEEEVRAKHQAGLLRLREKALKEKTRAEMAWLECQKQRHRDKGADDVMPSIRKRQRGVLMRLQAEQAEIKRLKAANRAASYERRLLLMQQEEIARLRKNTKKVRERAATEQAVHGQERTDNLKTGEKDSAEQAKSEAESTEVVEELDEKPADHSTGSRSSVSEDIKTASLSASAAASIAEEIPTHQSPGASRAESRPSSAESGTSERKRRLSEGDSDEGSAKEGTVSATKGSPTASDSTVMQKLKKLKHQSSERYLTLREQKLMKRRKEAENLLENKKKLLEWEKRLDKEESLVRNLLNEALNLESSRKQPRTTSITSEEEEHKDRSGREASASLSVSRTPSSKVISKDRSTQGTDRISESIKAARSHGHERSASESSVAEELSIPTRDRSQDQSERSRDSSIPEVDMKTRSQGSSIPEEIPEEYVNDTFESLDSSATPAHSTPVRSDLTLKRDTSPALSRRSSTGEGSKSEEDTSMTETSDHSDIESRVRRLRDQLEVRKREVKRLYNERKKQRKAMLRAQEASLRQELQAVEMVISRTKAELNRPQTDSKRPESGSTDQHPMSAKNDSSAREVRYHLSRTSDVSGGRKVTPSEKPVKVSARSEPAGGRVLSSVDAEVNSRGDQTISDVPSLKEKDEECSSVSEIKTGERNNLSLGKGETPLDKREDLDLTDRTRTPDKTSSENLRQSANSERKTSIRDAEDSREEIKDDVTTAEDVSMSEDIEVQTPSKASHSDKSERSSRGSSQSQSVSLRRGSDSDRKSSVRERSEVDVKITKEARTEENKSLTEENEVVTRPRSTHSGSHSTQELKESKDTDRSGQSGIVSGQNSIISEGSKSSRRSKSPALSEKSQSLQQAYSSSFESVENEVDKSEDDISEHISVEEDVENSERSERQDDAPDKPSAHPDQFLSKDEEGTRDISEVPEDISEQSEIEVTPKSTSLSAKSSGPVSEKAEQSLKGEKGLQLPEENKSGLVSYTDDFEPSAVDETDEGKPRGSYTPDFEPSESNVPVEDDKTSQEKEENDDFRFSSKKRELSEGVEVDDNKSPQEGQVQKPPKIPTLELEQATDEESIAEELDENIEGLEEISEDSDSGSLFEENYFKNEHGSLQRQIEDESVDEKEKIDKEVSPVSPGVLPTSTRQSPESRSHESDQKTADRITQDLSMMLLEESVNLATRVFDERRRIYQDLPKQSAKDSTPVEDGNDGASRSLAETSETEEISAHLSTSPNGSLESGLDRRTREREDFAPSPVEQPQQVSHEQKSNDIVNKLSDALLKEAASQMIAIMRSRQEKFAKTKGESTTGLTTSPRGATEDEPHSAEESPLSSPRNSRFMAVQRFPDGLLKYTEDTSTPPGSPTSEQQSSINERELTDKLDQLRRLHEHLESARGESEDERSEFKLNTNALMEFPSEEEDEEEETFRRSRGPSFLFSVPHRPNEVSPLVASSLSVFFERKRRGLPLDNVTPPSEIIGDDEADDDLGANSKRVYQRLVFDLTGNLFKDLLSEETPTKRPAWMKAKPRRKHRLHRGLQPLVREGDFLPVVQQQVLNLIGLGDARPSLERVRRKTPLKVGKKDFVDAILIQELREEEPLWVDYDDDELAVKFQVADAIFESLLSETVMVVNAVQLRREARADLARS
ncbi:hypothetical protein pdam_00010105 [Pocillopora damicornis]|uniref:CAP-Gly domain-containing protein n=1 Tax=Pocillopora damicornis TaxID=46731 RepID=A0A3M6V2N2_POCDA|nr:hypothetical protein pdam_00010105 [Pocillopora damicornis]